MSESSPLEEPLLSEDQALWVFIGLGWLAIGTLALATGGTTYGVASILLSVGAAYRVFRPG